MTARMVTCGGSGIGIPCDALVPRNRVLCASCDAAWARMTAAFVAEREARKAAAAG